MQSLDPELVRSTLLKLALPIATLGIVLIAARRRAISWRDGIGLRSPLWGKAAVWLAAWGAWLALSEFGINYFGLEQAKPWPPYPLAIVLLRILAIGILGPAAEELLMRGLILDRLKSSILGPNRAILVVALAWAAMHFSYGAATLVLFTLDGIWLGYARCKTNSIWVPISMHMAGNLLSIGQSLTL